MPKFYVEAQFTTRFVKEITAPSAEAAKATVLRGITLEAENMKESEHDYTTITDINGNVVE